MSEGGGAEMVIKGKTVEIANCGGTIMKIQRYAYYIHSRVFALFDADFLDSIARCKNVVDMLVSRRRDVSLFWCPVRTRR